MAKGRGNSNYKHGRHAGWTDYRYGADPAPVTLAGRKSIHKAGVRKQLVDQVADVMRDWRLSPFEHEGPCCQGLRSALCLKGHPWRSADAEANLLVASAIHQLGLTRPTQEQGQPDWSDGFDYCSTCRGRLDEGARSRKQRFCSADCARIAVNNRNLKARGPLSATRRAAHRIISKETIPPKVCLFCETAFQATETESEFCSRACGAQWRRSAKNFVEIECIGCGRLAKPLQSASNYCSNACRIASSIVRKEQVRVCICCSEPFTPRSDRSRFCSNKCDDRHRQREKGKLLGRGIYHRECEGCGTHFVSKVPWARTCAPSCSEVVTRWKKGKVRQITPRVFDYMLHREGVRITDDYREAA